MGKKSSFHATHATAARLVIPPGNGQLDVNLWAASDKAASVIGVNPATLKVLCDKLSASAATNLYVDKTLVNGYTVTAGDYVAVFAADGSVVWDSVASVTAGDKLVLSNNLGHVVNVGDAVYIVKQADIFSLPWGAQSANVNGFYIGQPKMPLVLTLDGTAKATLLARVEDVV